MRPLTASLGCLPTVALRIVHHLQIDLWKINILFGIINMILFDWTLWSHGQTVKYLRTPKVFGLDAMSSTALLSWVRAWKFHTLDGRMSKHLLLASNGNTNARALRSAMPSSSCPLHPRIACSCLVQPGHAMWHADKTREI